MTASAQQSGTPKLRIILMLDAWRLSARRFFAKLFPLSFNKGENSRRQEIFILILVFIIVCLSGLSVIAFYQSIRFAESYRGIPFEGLGIIVAACTGLLYLIRRGLARLAGGIFLTIYFLATAYGSFRWGASMPTGLLSYALLITMAGVILSPRFALLAAVASALSISLSGINEYAAGFLPAWKQHPVRLEDLSAYIILLGLAAILSWLFTRAIEKALNRALASEQALRKERDNLEITVEERTRAWKEAELRRSVDLGRFIEFGKLSAGMFHDLINPLTAVSLSLQILEREATALPAQVDAKAAIDAAIRGARRIEGHIARVRKHIKEGGQEREFYAEDELADICSILEYQARERHIIIEMKNTAASRLHGDPIKFYQACANLIVNSLEAFTAETSGQERRITLTVQEKNNGQELTVSDNAGGIDDELCEKIFQPFFTTKTNGLGLGLSTTKDIISEHFGGTIQCSSVPGHGTAFTLFFPARKKREGEEYA